MKILKIAVKHVKTMKIASCAGSIIHIQKDVWERRTVCGSFQEVVKRIVLYWSVGINNGHDKKNCTDLGWENQPPNDLRIIKT